MTSCKKSSLEQDIAAGFAAGEKSKLNISGSILTNEHTEKTDGAAVQVTWNEQPEPPIGEYLPP